MNTRCVSLARLTWLLSASNGRVLLFPTIWSLIRNRVVFTCGMEMATELLHG
jgi:hypothetical protein